MTDTQHNGTSHDVIFNKKAASEYIGGVSFRYLERLVSTGRLCALKPTPKLWRVRKSELDKFLNSGATIAA